ncbi:hypothetical protein EBT16_09885 [bacterium]|nr:hypothetical protein [bacterium]
MTPFNTMNLARARRGYEALKKYVIVRYKLKANSLFFKANMEENFIDLLTDVFHRAHQSGIDPNDIARVALEHYDREK